MCSDVWMVQRREHLRLATESGQTIAIVGDRRQQHLDRDVAIQLRVARAVDLAHAARAKGGEDLVGAEARAADQRQRRKQAGF